MSLIPEIKELIKSEYSRADFEQQGNTNNFHKLIIGDKSFEDIVEEAMIETTKENFIKGKTVSLNIPINGHMFNFTCGYYLKDSMILDNYRANTALIVDERMYVNSKYYVEDEQLIQTMLAEYIGDKSEIRFVFINKVVDLCDDDDDDYYNNAYNINMSVGTLKGSYVFCLFRHFEGQLRYWTEISWLNWEDYVSDDVKDDESTT